MEYPNATKQLSLTHFTRNSDIKEYIHTFFSNGYGLSTEIDHVLTTKLA